MTDFYRWLEENRKQHGELIAIFEKQIEYIANVNKRVRELEEEANFLASRLSNQNPNCDCGDVKYWRNWAREKRESQASTHQPVQVSRICSEDMPEPEEESNDCI